LKDRSGRRGKLASLRKRRGDKKRREKEKLTLLNFSLTIRKEKKKSRPNERSGGSPRVSFPSFPKKRGPTKKEKEKDLSAERAGKREKNQKKKGSRARLAKGGGRKKVSGGNAHPSKSEKRKAEPVALRSFRRGEEGRGKSSQPPLLLIKKKEGGTGEKMIIREGSNLFLFPRKNGEKKEEKKAASISLPSGETKVRKNRSPSPSPSF